MFEKPNFEGQCVKVDGDLCNLAEEQEGEETGRADRNMNTLQTVGSVKILGGL